MHQLYLGFHLLRFVSFLLLCGWKCDSSVISGDRSKVDQIE